MDRTTDTTRVSRRFRDALVIDLVMKSPGSESDHLLHAAIRDSWERTEHLARQLGFEDYGAATHDMLLRVIPLLDELISGEWPPGVDTPECQQLAHKVVETLEPLEVYAILRDSPWRARTVSEGTVTGLVDKLATILERGLAQHLAQLVARWVYLGPPERRQAAPLRTTGPTGRAQSEAQAARCHTSDRPGRNRFERSAVPGTHPSMAVQVRVTCSPPDVGRVLPRRPSGLAQTTPITDHRLPSRVSGGHTVKWWVNVGGYKGPATLAGLPAEVDLVATRPRRPTTTGDHEVGAVQWRGSATFDEPPAHLFELHRSPTLTINIEGNDAAVTIVHANATGDVVDISGQGDPPFNVNDKSSAH